jgi:aryl-alcohol dehydrogenase-like predicted oxidoreductase
VPRFAPDVLPANMALAESGQDLGARKNVTPAQLSLAWLSGAEAVDRADPGHHQRGASGGERRRASVTFSAAELTELNAAVAAIPIRGERLSPAVLSAPASTMAAWGWTSPTATSSASPKALP